jgi:hypothetical protein
VKRALVHKRKSVTTLGLAVLAGLVPFQGTARNASAQEGPSEEEQAQANNPLASAYALNFQNFYSPSLYGVPEARSQHALGVPALTPVTAVLWQPIVENSAGIFGEPSLSNPAPVPGWGEWSTEKRVWVVGGIVVGLMVLGLLSIG